MKKWIILCVGLIWVGATVVTAGAAVDLYGSLRFRTYYNSYNSDAMGSSWGTTEWKNDGLSRLGMNFKSGDITGKWEIDAATNAAGYDQKGHGGSERGAMRLRLAYGVWDFGSGSLLIGQDFPLTDHYVSSLYHSDNDMQGWGGLGFNEARVAQMKLKFGNLQFALITPYTAIDPSGMTVGSVNAYLPKLEAKYNGKIGTNFNYALIGGLQTYKANDYAVGASGTSESITSYILAVTARYNYKALSIAALGKYAQNSGNYGLCAGNPANSFSSWGIGMQHIANVKRADIAHIVSGDVKNASTWGGIVSVGYKFSDLFFLEAGYGYVDHSVADKSDNGQAAYLHARFTVAPGVFIMPEFVYYDAMTSKNGSVKVNDGALTTFGIMWRIDFK